MCESNASIADNEYFLLSRKRAILAQESMVENDVDVIILFDGNQAASKFIGTTAPFGAILIFKEYEPLIVAPPVFKEQAGSRIDTEILYFEDNPVSTLRKAITTRIANKKRLKVGFDSWGLEYSLWLILQRIGWEVQDVAATVLIDSLRRPFREELKDIVKISNICDCGLKAAYEVIALGTRECDVVAEADRAMWKAGATRFRFPSLVSSGIKCAFPHSNTTQKAITRGDTIIVDLSPMYWSYDGDVSRSFVLGHNKKWARYHQILCNSVFEALSIVREGTPSSDIDSKMREILAKRGLPTYPHMTGHPIGGFRAPFITMNSKDLLLEDMAFVIEPAVYLNGIGGIRIERHVLVKKNGFEILDTFDPEFEINR